MYVNISVDEAKQGYEQLSIGQVMGEGRSSCPDYDGTGIEEVLMSEG